MPGAATLLPGAEPRSPAEETVHASSFVVILCDNLGYGDTGPYGSTLQRTPNLDRVAREGLRFTHFYATAGVGTPSRAGLPTPAVHEILCAHGPTR